jgi:peptidoglycan DL-endopeptidase RipA
MVEAPESGKVVRIAPVRFDDEIVQTVTRPLG